MLDSDSSASPMLAFAAPYFRDEQVFSRGGGTPTVHRAGHRSCGVRPFLLKCNVQSFEKQHKQPFAYLHTVVSMRAAGASLHTCFKNRLPAAMSVYV